MAKRTGESRHAPAVAVHGHCDPRWSAVRELVETELQAQAGGGLAVAVVHDHRCVLHLWGGNAAKGTRRQWAADTLVCLFSASKPLAAALVLKLVERGLIDLDATVSTYWPGFAQAGKDRVTVRHALAHLAGIPALPAATPATIYDRDALTRSVEVQGPLWAPGTQGCFHSFTYGILASELVRRVTGDPFGECFRRELGMAFGGQLAFSLTLAEQARCAKVMLPPDNPLLRMMCDQETELGRSWAPMNWDELNTERFRAADFPSIAGHASALGLARFYGMLAGGGVLDGEPFLSRGLVEEALTEHWHQPDPFIGAPVRMGLGVMLANEVFPFTGGPSSFAQPGLGGIAGVGDREAGLGIGVVVNILSAGLQNPFLDRLTAIAMECAA